MKLSKRAKFVALIIVLILFIGLMRIANAYVQRLFYPREYSEYVEKYSSEYNVPEYIVYSVIKVESDFDKNAKSDAGACGLMQLMPNTHKWLVNELDITEKGIFDEDENIRCGTYYLSLLYEKYDNWTLTFCAYNAGMGNVDSWLDKEPFSIEFTETKYYVKKLEVVQEKYLSLYYR